MKFTFELKSDTFSLMDVGEEDIGDFILTEKLTHYKYVAEYKSFFGEWNEDILRRAFELNIPVFLVVIKTNPAQILYEKLGFERYKDQDVFYHYRYKG